MAKCIYCEGNTIKVGKQKKRQRRKCKECGKTFLENNYKPRISQENKDKIKKLFKEGFSKRKIAKELNINEKSVRNILKKK